MHIVSCMITLMPFPCHWPISTVAHKRTLETLIISHVQAFVSLSCIYASVSMPLAVRVDVEQVNLLYLYFMIKLR